MELINFFEKYSKFVMTMCFSVYPTSILNSPDNETLTFLWRKYKCRTVGSHVTQVSPIGAPRVHGGGD